MSGERKSDRKDSDFIDHDEGEHDLPTYDAIGSAPAPYSEAETEHEFSLKDNKGRSFLVLKVRSNAPASSLPTFFEGQPIGGKVSLDLDKPESIKSITVSIEGAARFSRLDDRSFIKITETLYKHEGESRGIMGNIMGNGDKMPAGKRDFEFRITLPYEAKVDKALWHDLKVSESVRLPPTLSSRAWNWAFYYEIVVQVKRYGLLAVDDVLKQIIGYTPLVKEPKPSLLRIQAYKDGSPVPGPTVDKDGWKTFPLVEIKGELFKTRKVSGTYSLSIAAPLAYAAGTLVPFFLLVESDDEQALAVLADHGAPDVSIRRKIKSVPGVGDTGGNLVLPGAEEERPISKVVWAGAPGGSRMPAEFSQNSRLLYGEMRLPDASRLRPSFEFGDFHMKYCIDMYPPTVTGFKSESPNRRLLRADVEIFTEHYGEPRPRSYLPSGSVPCISANADRWAGLKV